MLFEWDDGKARSNAHKHGIEFQDAILAFYDPHAVVIQDVKHSAQEVRLWLIGDNGALILVVVCTIRLPGSTVRIISARPAGREERRRYEQRKAV